MSTPNPIIGHVVCQQCGAVETVHEVKRGGSTRRGQLYTRCPNCKTNQTGGAVREAYLLKHTIPLPEYADIFEFKSAPGQKPESKQTAPDSGLETDKQTETKPKEKPSKPDQDDDDSPPPSPVVGLSILGVLFGLGLAAVGFAK